MERLCILASTNDNIDGEDVHIGFGIDGEAVHIGFDIDGEDVHIGFDIDGEAVFRSAAMGPL